MKAHMTAAIMFVLFCTHAAYAQETYIGVVKTVTGKITIHRDAGVIDAVPGMNLLASDTLVSGSDASSGIVFNDGTLLSIGPSSKVDIEKYVFDPAEEQYDFSLYIKKGNAVYSSGKIGKLAPDKIKVKTPRATLGIRGTSFIVDVD